MANSLLTETHCASLLVVVLASRYGFEFNNSRCYARKDDFKQKMFIRADVSNGEGLNMRRFVAELTFDNLQKTSWDVEEILAAQVQSQVFSTWSDV